MMEIWKRRLDPIPSSSTALSEMFSGITAENRRSARIVKCKSKADIVHTSYRKWKSKAQKVTRGQKWERRNGLVTL